MLSVEVPVVLYQAITGQKSSRWSLLFQPVNLAGSRRLATTLGGGVEMLNTFYFAHSHDRGCNLVIKRPHTLHKWQFGFSLLFSQGQSLSHNSQNCKKKKNIWVIKLTTCTNKFKWRVCIFAYACSQKVDNFQTLPAALICRMPATLHQSALVPRMTHATVPPPGYKTLWRHKWGQTLNTPPPPPPTFAPFTYRVWY